LIFCWCRNARQQVFAQVGGAWGGGVMAGSLRRGAGIGHGSGAEAVCWNHCCRFISQSQAVHWLQPGWGREGGACRCATRWAWAERQGPP